MLCGCVREGPACGGGPSETFWRCELHTFAGGQYLQVMVATAVGLRLMVLHLVTV